MDEIRRLVIERTEALVGENVGGYQKRGWCELARRTGRHRVALHRAFKGYGPAPTLNTLLDVAAVLGLKVVLVDEGAGTTAPSRSPR